VLSIHQVAGQLRSTCGGKASGTIGPPRLLRLEGELNQPSVTARSKGSGLPEPFAGQISGLVVSSQVAGGHFPVTPLQGRLQKSTLRAPPPVHSDAV
jgi:hypothetical protein